LGGESEIGRTLKGRASLKASLNSYFALLDDRREKPIAPYAACRGARN